MEATEDTTGAGDIPQLVEYLPSMRQALGLISSTTGLGVVANMSSQHSTGRGEIRSLRSPLTYTVTSRTAI